MPLRPLLADLRCRNRFICPSCICNLTAVPRPTSQPWTASAAYSSRAARRARPRARMPSEGPLSRILSERDATSPQAPADTVPDSRANNDYIVRNLQQIDDPNNPDAVVEDSLLTPDLAEKALGQGFGFGKLKSLLTSKDDRAALHEVMSQVGVDWANIKTEQDMEDARAKMKAYTESIDKQIEQVTADLPKELVDKLNQSVSGLTMIDSEDHRVPQAQIPQIPTQAWTLNQRKKVAKLNSVIRLVAPRLRDGTITKKHISTIYKSYQQTRLALAHGWNNVPIDVWDFFWGVFSTDESINPHRLSHISLLASDMNEAKVVLSPPQQLLTIEAMFVEGWESKAMDSWKRCAGTLGQESSEMFQEYWELGVRMHCRLGDMEQAERAVNRLVESHHDPRIMLPVIRTYAERTTPEDRDKAWTSYRRMRDLLGRDMKLEDYDHVVSYFLGTGQTEHALYTFVDMMSDGEIDLKKQRFLPSVVANKFFLGKWLKRLIGADDLDGAFEVVEFMRSKGVEASTIHLNGLVGAWHRTGLADDVDKADALAWSMIENRINFVQARRSGDAQALQLLEKDASGKAPLPRATLETFSLLAENYRVRGLHSQLEELWEAFPKAEISPNVFMMNQLIESYIKAGDYDVALNLYDSLTTRGIQPDPYTFSALWKTLAINRSHSIADSEREHQFQVTRQLFAETVKFKDVFGPSGMDGQLARKILHSFRRLRDHAGFLVALKALRDVFNFLPPETLVFEMMLGTTKIGWDTERQRRQLMTLKTELDRDLLAWAGGNAAKLEGENRGTALYEYLRKRFWPTQDTEDDVARALGAAAMDMGVSEVLTGKR